MTRPQPACQAGLSVLQIVRSMFLRPPARRLPQGSMIGPASRRSQRSGSGTRYADLQNAVKPAPYFITPELPRQIGHDVGHDRDGRRVVAICFGVMRSIVPAGV